jgi:hypothetical protein
MARAPSGRRSADTARLGQLLDLLDEPAAQADVPVRLALALAWVVSRWQWEQAAYDPNYDGRAITGRASLWNRHPEWLRIGATADDFFTFHVDRRAEWSPERDYTYVAQTRLASRYGVFQLRYPDTLVAGYTGAPEGLCDVREQGWGCRLLGWAVDDARHPRRSASAQLREGVRRFARRTGHPPELDDLVDRAHREWFSRGAFEVRA